MRTTKIEWTDHTFNPWIGCTKVSEGCQNCYAANFDHRNLHGRGDHWGKGVPRFLYGDEKWEQPLKWDRQAGEEGQRRRIFCASDADVFDAEVPKAWRQRLWNLIRKCRNLDWQLLTKRPQNIERFLPNDWNLGNYGHVWLGASVENQKRADERIKVLTSVPASIHFLSAEPLLSPINFRTLKDVEWVIVGGESGPRARSMEMGWATDILDQCRENNVACFVKQLGKRPIVISPDEDEAISWPVSDSHGKNVKEWWEELRVREFPLR